MWEQKSSGLVESDIINGIAVNTDGSIFTISASSPPFGGGISRSTDQGNSWTNFYFASGTAIACNSQGHVFAGSYSTVYRSTDNGDTWTFVDVSPVQNIADIAFDGNTVYLATGTPFGFGSQGVYRSTDNGTAWAPFNNGLTNLNVTTISVTDTGITSACPPTSCGTDGDGVFDLQGDSWISEGPPGAVIRDIERRHRSDIPADYWLGLTAAALYTRESIDPIVCAVILLTRSDFESIKAEILAPPPSNSLGEPDVVYLLGSAGHGIQRALNLISSVAPSGDFPVETSLSQNYPNPFNPKTKIVYGLKSRESVELKIYDLLGRDVATLVNEKKAPGTYEVTWDASGQASGVYFYRLSTPNFVQTKKLVLLR
jgi:hypothetical protein